MLSLSDIVDAEKAIGRFVNRTPLVPSKFFSDFCKSQVYLKLENIQITNAFKIRGAFNKLLNLSSKERKLGIITSSAGNHAQAIAIGANQFNIPAKIVIPSTTPKVKIEKIQKYDVELILHGKVYDEAEQMAKDLAKKEEMSYISPYNDDFIIAGQGTVGLEIFEDLPKVDSVLVPVGGGGLISGVSIALKSLNRDIEIYGFQSKASPVMFESLKAGRIVDAKIKDSIADGLSGGIEKDTITFNIIKTYVDDLKLVKEESIRNAISLLLKEENQVVEGAGAVAVAGLLENPTVFRGKTIVAVLSGGNIDDELLQEIADFGSA